MQKNELYFKDDSIVRVLALKEDYVLIIDCVRRKMPHSGYYCIYSSSRQDNIISNDNFDGQRYVTVSDGQYLLLSRCKFVDPPQTPEVEITDTETIKQIQELLNSNGYQCGTPDGIAGQNTRNAVIEYKKANGMEATSVISQKLLDSLKTITTSSEESNTAREIL